MMSLRFASRAALAVICCGALAFSPVSNAQNVGNIPFPEKTISITGRGTPVGDFLKDLFGRAGLSVKVSQHPSLNELVNGPFPGKPAVIWREIAKAYNLVGYFDGSTVRIYAAEEIKDETIATSTPAELEREAKRLGYAVSFNTIKAGKNSVVLRGSPIFIDRIKKLANTVTAATPVISTTPIIAQPAGPATDIISPSLPGGGGSGATPASVGLSSYDRSQLVSSVSARQPYEVRIFNLKYASAEDRTVRSLSGQDTVIEGIATLLQKTMGDGRLVSNVSMGNNGFGKNGSLTVPNTPDVSSDYPGGRYGGGPVIVQQREPRNLDGPRITAHRSKQLIIKDRPESMKAYGDMIDVLDVERRPIEIQITIVEYNTDYNKELGVSAGLNIGGFSAVIGGPASDPAGGLSPANLSGSYTAANSNSVGIAINALEKQGWLQVTTRTMSPTVDDVPLFFSDGDDIPFRVQANEDAKLFSKQAQLGMEVHPRIIDDGGELRVELVVLFIDGSISGQTLDGTVIGSTVMNNTTTVRQGESMIIGGLTVDSKFDNKSKVPGLSAIPAFGELFKKRRKGSSRIEKVYIITPRIMGNGVLPKASMMQPKSQAAPTKATPAKKKTSKRTRA
jgi:type III secretion protein C